MYKRVVRFDIIPHPNHLCRKFSESNDPALSTMASNIKYTGEENSDFCNATPLEYNGDEKNGTTNVIPPASELGTSKVIHVGKMDEGLRILEDRGDEGGYVLDPAVRKRVLRKIDIHVLPILTSAKIFKFDVQNMLTTSW